MNNEKVFSGYKFYCYYIDNIVFLKYYRNDDTLKGYTNILITNRNILKKQAYYQRDGDIIKKEGSVLRIKVDSITDSFIYINEIESFFKWLYYSTLTKKGKRNFKIQNIKTNEN